MPQIGINYSDINAIWIIYAGIKQYLRNLPN